MQDDDNRLPTIRRDNLPANARDQEPSRMTTLARFIRGQLSRVDATSLKRITDAVDAYTALEVAKGKLADAKTETDRKIARFKRDRDKLIADDAEQTDHEVALNRERRARERAAAQAGTEQAHKQLSEAQHDRELHDQLLPKRKERAHKSFETGDFKTLHDYTLAEQALAGLGGASNSDAGAVDADATAALAVLKARATQLRTLNPQPAEAILALEDAIRAIEASKEIP